jgi:ABC-type multidrug transport system permease subunit
VLASCVLHEKSRQNGRLEIRAAKAHVWSMVLGGIPEIASAVFLANIATLAILFVAQNEKQTGKFGFWSWMAIVVPAIFVIATLSANSDLLLPTAQANQTAHQ